MTDLGATAQHPLNDGGLEGYGPSVRLSERAGIAVSGVYWEVLDVVVGHGSCFR
jgi:hypothetical protein